MKILKSMFIVASLAVAAQASAIPVRSGQTNVLLDLPLLESGGLVLSGVGGPVIAPGELGAASVAFPINSRNAMAPSLATTFEYTEGSLAPFAGTIEHSGTVLFNVNTLEVGNFTIGYDASRVSATTSGFFVADNVTFSGIALFDVGIPSALSALRETLSITADLLVSPELAGVLGSAGAGVDVGDVLVNAVATPEPGSLALLLGGLGCLGLALARRRVETTQVRR